MQTGFLPVTGLRDVTCRIRPIRMSVTLELNWTQKNWYHQCADTKVGKNVKACNIVFTLITLKQHSFIVQTHSIW